MKNLLAGITATLGAAGALAFYLFTFVGWLYWVWTAIQLGSFVMFVLGLLGPLAFIAAIFGMWSLVFGVPIWLLRLMA